MLMPAVLGQRKGTRLFGQKFSISYSCAPDVICQKLLGRERERERKGGNEILNLSLLSKNVQNVHMLKTEFFFIFFYFLNLNIAENYLIFISWVQSSFNHEAFGTISLLQIGDCFKLTNFDSAMSGGYQSHMTVFAVSERFLAWLI